jgi:hypothetical protein
MKRYHTRRFMDETFILEDEWIRFARITTSRRTFLNDERASSRSRSRSRSPTSWSRSARSVDGTSRERRCRRVHARDSVRVCSRSERCLLARREARSRTGGRLTRGGCGPRTQRRSLGFDGARRREKSRSMRHPLFRLGLTGCLRCLRLERARSSSIRSMPLLSLSDACASLSCAEATQGRCPARAPRRARGSRRPSQPRPFEPLFLLYLRAALLRGRSLSPGRGSSPGRSLSSPLRRHRHRRAPPHWSLDARCAERTTSPSTWSIRRRCPRA